MTIATGPHVSQASTVTSPTARWLTRFRAFFTVARSCGAERAQAKPIGGLRS